MLSAQDFQEKFVKQDIFGTFALDFYSSFLDFFTSLSVYTVWVSTCLWSTYSLPGPLEYRFLSRLISGVLAKSGPLWILLPQADKSMETLFVHVSLATGVLCSSSRKRCWLGSVEEKAFWMRPQRNWMQYIALGWLVLCSRKFWHTFRGHLGMQVMQITSLEGNWEVLGGWIASLGFIP